jgi:hypothetical protein
MRASADIAQEILDELDGSRSRTSKGRAAVRIEDLTGIVQLRQRMQAIAAAGSTPTKAEYDALVRDVSAVRQALAIVAEALQRRLNPQ